MEKLLFTANVLGTPYEVFKTKESDDPNLKDCSGYTDVTTKKIVVEDMGTRGDKLDNMKVYENKTIRHELIHAFIFESGLDGEVDWATNEEVVDWIAMQFPKIAEAFKNIKEGE